MWNDVQARMLGFIFLWCKCNPNNVTNVQNIQIYNIVHYTTLSTLVLPSYYKWHLSFQLLTTKMTTKNDMMRNEMIIFSHSGQILLGDNDWNVPLKCSCMINIRCTFCIFLNLMHLQKWNLWNLFHGKMNQ